MTLAMWRGKSSTASSAATSRCWPTTKPAVSRRGCRGRWRPCAPTDRRALTHAGRAAHRTIPSGIYSCLDKRMEPDRIVSATRVISASAETIFDLIADPSKQPSWDGNNNLASADAGQRVRQVGDIFTMTLTNGAVRENHVVEFIE